jgi:hypothetical protein
MVYSSKLQFTSENVGYSGLDLLWVLGRSDFGFAVDAEA